MRLLHVLTVPITLRFLRGQVEFVSNEGFDVHVACAPGPQLDEFAATRPVTTHAIELSRRVDPRGDLASLTAMARLIREVRPDIVHAHTPKGGLIGMMAAAACRVPKRIYHLRGLPLLTATGPMRRVLWTTESISFASAHRVLSVSHSLADAVRDAHIVGASKARVLCGGSGNGIDTRRFDPKNAPTRAASRAAFALDPDHLVVACVGRLVRDKGIPELLRAWAGIRTRGDATLFVVGPLEERDALRPEEVEQLQSDPTIRHLPFTEDMPAVYAASDLVVLPSHREGFPNVPLEAAAMCLPVVTTDAVGCRDAVVEGETGQIVRVGDAVGLERAIVGYLASESLRREHGEAGRRRAVRDFDPEQIWRALVAEYHA
jgi:glycosyltransferase involved in cell wall biosynthesis